MKKRIASFVCVIAMLLSVLSIGTVNTSAAEGSKWLAESGLTPSPDEYDYSFIIVGDTQCIAYLEAINRNSNKEDTHYLDTMYKWIVDNKDEKKIAHVFGVGDVTDRDHYTENKTYFPVASEWEIAKAAIQQLDGKVSYSLARGNHDNSIIMNNYLNTAQYRAQYDGVNGGFSPYESVLVKFYEDKYPGRFSYDRKSNGFMENSWKIVDAGEDKYLIFTIDCDCSQQMIDWVNQIITEKTALYPEIKVVLTTHDYINPKGVRNKEVTSEELEPYGALPPNEIYEQIVKKNSNVCMVLGGHYTDGEDESLLVKQTFVGRNSLTEILCDPQGLDANLSMPLYDKSANICNNFSKSGYPVVGLQNFEKPIDPEKEMRNDYAAVNDSKPAGLLAILYVMKDGSTIIEYYSPIRQQYWGECNQIRLLRGITGKRADATTAPATTAEPTATPAETTDEGKKGCGGSIGLSAVAVASIATAGMALALKRRKEE